MPDTIHEKISFRDLTKHEIGLDHKIINKVSVNPDGEVMAEEIVLIGGWTEVTS